MSEVPPDLYSNILSRVFVESLLRFRCVCKAWRRIIDDPAFIKLHLHHQSNRDQLIFCNDAGTKHYTLSLDSFNHYSSRIPIGKVVVASPLKTWIRHIPYLPVASCNGLILFSNRIRSVWALWNPFTREVHELPSHTTVLSNQWKCFSCIALGYDSATDDYKVVKIVECEHRLLTLVYSLKSNSWRRVKDCPSCPWLEVRGVFVNGALHWSTYPTIHVREGSILVFDLVTEDYYKIPLPSGHFHYMPILDALGECLLVTWNGSVYRLDNYGGGGGGGGGGEKSWTKLFSFSDMGFRGDRPIAYLKIKGKVLLESDNDEYFWVNIKKKSAKKVIINGVQDCRYSQICLASLVRLK